ncbi:binding-protein-dependent transport systems inner membrane component [Beutenbergia cavernae DSM 12333]|uniref:Binding-protein-dependent transport systems inner membrane component n=1 Tax=Beutenbergia cavernae (strain ATCC BAA-8 / DSM 12333 / CCUG 43141 / JCM 11478 / NBRC 16432 / NCIMB 13614 / HKI 0122) TaxID=471853 RepID=C5BUV2_BEUC1|nr:carbohydrate ABC transporter permease [Beutenbergia cavernae]ACQ78326.1 binding-protein-dependent transport systems inner membrane component [Beutenbergia cavernae DSM 12333]
MALFSRPAATAGAPGGSLLSTLRPRTGGDLAFMIGLGLVCVVILFATLYPIYFVAIASVSDPTLVSTGRVSFWPRGINWFGYEQIFADARIWTGYRNTLLYTVVGTALNLVVTLPAAYALSRREFAPRRFLMLFFAFTMFFSGGLIPTYLLYRDLNLLDNWLVFVLPSAVNVYNLIIARAFFEHSLPEELFEAATLDGSTYFQFFFRMAVPLSMAIISVIGLYYLVQHWNDFFTGLVFVRDYSKQPLQIVLRDILISNQAFSGGAGGSGGSGGGSYAQQYADQIKYGVIIVSTLPVILLYPFLQRYFEKGVMIGSVKG